VKTDEEKRKWTASIRDQWFMLCDLADVAPDTRRPAREIVERLNRKGSVWTTPRIQQAMDAYEQTLMDGA
jgi:hypothetical protein